MAGTPMAGVPRISIRHGLHHDETPAASAAAPTAARNNRFSTDALNTAWETYIQTHPKAHILINTMRAAPPRLDSDTHFTVLVQNQMQADLMESARHDLLTFLHNTLQNDSITFDTAINEGELPRHTLSDGELLGQMCTDYPALQHLIDDLKLRLS